VKVREFSKVCFLVVRSRETQVCERRAESGERRLESGKYRFCWIILELESGILGEAVPISVEFDIFGIFYLEMYPIAMHIITQFF
jgi:hypothetical protein